MSFWKGECSRAFTDWRGLQYGVGDGAWLTEHAREDAWSLALVTAEQS
jgi:hypothetical protein